MRTRFRVHWMGRSPRPSKPTEDHYPQLFEQATWVLRRANVGPTQYPRCLLKCPNWKALDSEEYLPTRCEEERSNVGVGLHSRVSDTPSGHLRCANCSYYVFLCVPGFSEVFLIPMDPGSRS